MATPRVNMKGFYKQQKKGNSIISKSSKSNVSNKTPPSHSAAAQPAAPVSHGGAQDYDQNEEVLRQFDLNMVYGPCIGMPRLDRWNRANKLGMNPPKEVETLLKSSKIQAGSLWDGRV